MTVEQFSTKLIEKGSTNRYSLLARTTVGGTTELLQITSIPPLLVYDGFVKDHNAAEVIKRVSDIYRGSVGQAMTLHIQRFLLSCLSSHNINNLKP